MKTQSKVREVPCLLGVGSYWAWTLLDRSSLVLPGGFGAGVDPSALTGITFAVVALILLASYILNPSKMGLIMRGAVALAAALACGSYLIAQMFSDGLLGFFSSILLAVLRSGLMVIWTIWVLSRGRAGMVRTLIIGSSVAVIMYLIVSGLPQPFAMLLFYVLVAASGFLTLLIGDISEAFVRDEAGEEPARRAVAFHIVRFLLGFLIGLTASITVSIELVQMSGLQMVVSLFLCIIPAVFAFAVLRAESKLSLLIILCPLVLSVCFIIPAALQPTMLLYVSVSLIWFCTIFVSTAHIYFNIGLRGWSLVVLVAWAQLASSVGTFFGNSLASASFFAGIYEVPLLLRVLFSLLAFYVMLMVSVYFLSRLLARRRGEGYSVGLDAAVSRLSQRYGLTSREEEVLGLLAAGYSRPYISKKLVLSTSTVKTHVNHVYQKIGINKHDDLLDMIDDEKKEINSYDTAEQLF